MCQSLQLRLVISKKNDKLNELVSMTYKSRWHDRKANKFWKKKRRTIGKQLKWDLVNQN